MNVESLLPFYDVQKGNETSYIFYVYKLKDLSETMWEGGGSFITREKNNTRCAYHRSSSSQ